MPNNVLDRNSKLINYVSKEVPALKTTETRLFINFNFYAHLAPVGKMQKILANITTTIL
jgi:hypothetical protein